MKYTLQTVPTTLPVSDSLSQYMNWANQFPMLTEAEEKELAHRLQHTGDVEAAEQLVLSHLRFVVKIAHQYTGYGLALPDLVQEGTIGLMKGVKRFDPNVGVRLVSFAVHWIKAEIHEFVIRNWRIVKVATTKAQRKLFFNLRKHKTRLGLFTTEEVKMVADELGVKPEDVLNMEMRLSGHDMALEHQSHEEDGIDMISPIHYLQAPTESEPLAQLTEETQSAYETAHLATAISALDSRSIEIIEHRFLSDKKMTLKTLADKYKISVERVRQLEKAALDKLKGLLSSSH